MWAIWILIGAIGGPATFWIAQVLIGKRALRRASKGLRFTPAHTDAYLPIMAAVVSTSPRLKDPLVFRAIAIYVATFGAVDLHNAYVSPIAAQLKAAQFLKNMNKFIDAAKELDRVGTLPENVRGLLPDYELREATKPKLIDAQ